MSKPASKFAWIYALAADHRLTESAKYFGTIIALQNLDPGRVTFRVRQATIAEKCAASDRNVRRGFSALRQTGWIELVDERKRGRGNRGADQYRLNIPEIPDRLAPITNEQIPDRTDRNTGQDRQKYRTEVTEIPDRADAVTSDDYDLKGFDKGITKGIERGFAAGCADAAPLSEIASQEEEQQPADPRPPTFCGAHMPNGAPDGVKCGDCGTRRVALAEWHRRNPEAVAEPSPPAPVSTLNPDCPLCGGYGRLLGDEDTPVRPAVPCPSCRPASLSAGAES